MILELKSPNDEHAGLYRTSRIDGLEAIQKDFDEATRLAIAAEENDDEYAPDIFDDYLDSKLIERIFADVVTTTLDL